MSIIWRFSTQIRRLSFNIKTIERKKHFFLLFSLRFFRALISLFNCIPERHLVWMVGVGKKNISFTCYFSSCSWHQDAVLKYIKSLIYFECRKVHINRFIVSEFQCKIANASKAEIKKILSLMYSKETNIKNRLRKTRFTHFFLSDFLLFCDWHIYGFAIDWICVRWKFF